MRQEPRSPWSPALDRLREAYGRSRRWVAGRGAATRVGLAAAGLAAVGLLGYLANAGDPDAGPASAVLYEGRRLSTDDLKAIAKALDAAEIKYATDPSARRVVVRADRKGAALAAIAKAKAVPTSLDEINRDDEPEPAWGYTPAERERRDVDRLEKGIKRQIEALNPAILSAQVQIRRERARGSWNARWNVRAYVYLEVEGRPLEPKVVDGIENFLLGAVPDLKPEAITVLGADGHAYMVAGNAPLKEQVRIHSQEEQWGDKIAGLLQHIPHVGVSVSLESVAAAPPPPLEPLAAPTAEVAVNKPLRVAAEPAMPVAPDEPPPPQTRANVWVRVPRSFYLMAAQAQAPGRHPSPEDLQQMQATTTRLVHEAVNISIPKEMRGKVQVDTVQDDLVAARPVVLPPDPAEPLPAWLVPAVASGAGVALLASTVAGVRLATRRPARRPAAAWRPGFVADRPDSGPSERVRELIRSNPQAAAGVLQRWVGQGGAVG